MPSTFYSFLDPVLGVFFSFTPTERLNHIIGVFSMSLLVAALISVVSAKVIDQKELKKLKEELAGYQKKLKEAQEKSDTKTLNKLQKEMLEKQSAMMSMSFKPMIFNMVPILLIFGWMRNFAPLQSFIASNGGILVNLPFALPHWGDSLGWFGWYILSSFPLSSLIRKLLKLEM